jgi:hypothetical protein
MKSMYIFNVEQTWIHTRWNVGGYEYVESKSVITWIWSWARGLKIFAVESQCVAKYYTGH